MEGLGLSAGTAELAGGGAVACASSIWVIFQPAERARAAYGLEVFGFRRHGSWFGYFCVGECTHGSETVGRWRGSGEMAGE